MRKPGIICFLLCLTFAAGAQNEIISKGKIGISFSTFGENDVVRFDELVGAASYSGRDHFTFGLNYFYPLNHTFELETGLEYSKHEVDIHPNLPPTVDAVARSEDLSLLVIPVALRLTFLNYLFVNGGALIDLDLSSSNPVDSQTGIGVTLGIGANYDFNCGVSISLNPYLRIHSLVPFSFDDHHQRLTESGIRFGIAYQL